MVDFNKLRSNRIQEKIIDPIEIFRRLPKPQGINDLYSSQSEVLRAWFEQREEKDTVIKLHTGGGKTLVALLMAQSSMNENKGPVLYLTPTKQLVSQTLEKARELDISAIPYDGAYELDSDFRNGQVILVATYNALFNGLSKFGVSGRNSIETVGTIILDDAHTSFSIVRDSFTMEIKNEGATQEVYTTLCHLFRKSFIDVGKGGTFDDVVSGNELVVLDVPYWDWNKKIPSVAESLKKISTESPFVFMWPLLRDNLKYCYALISKDSFVITPIVPFIDMFPTFIEAKRRIYMSATIADDSDIIETFGISEKAIENSLKSNSLAGVSERMILIPDLIDTNFSTEQIIKGVMEATSKRKCGSVILSPSSKKAEKWASFSKVIKGNDVQEAVCDLQEGRDFGPVAFVNRYDGIDLPGSSCRLLVMDGLPVGTSNFELFKSSRLLGSGPLRRILAQRIEQGLGRASRGTSDYSVNILIGKDLVNWISQTDNLNCITSTTRAQINIGREISEEVHSPQELWEVITQSYKRDQNWVAYHSERLAELTSETEKSINYSPLATVERKAMELWKKNYHENAIKKIRGLAESSQEVDSHSKGWLYQLAAKIAYDWGNMESFDLMQKQAYSLNSQMTRPQNNIAYTPIPIPEKQSKMIVKQCGPYRNRKGFLSKFDETIALLTTTASPHQFEGALAKLADLIGFQGERFDNNGVGPDVLWILSENRGIIFEAKSNKLKSNPLTKDQHGQLLVADKWAKKEYPNVNFDLVSVHPSDISTEAASASDTYVLTQENLIRFIADSREIIKQVAESQLDEVSLVRFCEDLLRKSSISKDLISEKYFIKFKTDQNS